MTLPNFLIIGAAKSGTTALYRYLKQHPEIYMSPRKEPHFFSYDENTKRTNGPGDYVRTAITNLTEYQKLFDHVTTEKVIGEASPTYIYITGTAERIYQLIPSVKLIAILRHPVDRAFSAYMHQFRDGHEESSTFIEAISREEYRIKNNWGPIWHYINGGFYYQQLHPYYQIFRRDQIKIIIYDDLILNPDIVMKNIFHFLEVDESFLPDMSLKPNTSGVPKSKVLYKSFEFLFNHPNPIKSISRMIFSEELRWRVTTYIRNKNLNKTSLPNELRRKLLQLYIEDIIKLQDLINHDLSIWIK